MGIKNLSKFLKQDGKDVDIKYLTDLRLAIDISIFLYRFKYLSEQEEFLKKFENQINFFKKYNVYVVYIFDGKPPIEKQSVIEQRKSKENRIKITENDIVDVKNLFNKHNVKYFVSPTEAEKFCALLEKEDIVDGVISNDFDTLVFGCKNLFTYKNFNSFTEYKLDKILEKNEITMDSFIDICIASGCDYYHKGLKGIGINRGISLAKKYGEIENWKVNIPEDLKLSSIRNIFKDFSDILEYIQGIDVKI